MNNASIDKTFGQHVPGSQVENLKNRILEKNPIIVHIGTQINIFSSKSMNSQHSSNFFNSRSLSKHLGTNKSNK